uniref:Ig-like domain-containing protein n=1 Tax=Cuerna arida TaxID=1464854 RepID=A0A1B6EJK1_9HEMI
MQVYSFEMALLAIFLFLFNIQGYLCIFDVKVSVLPPVVKVGGNITVGCSYTLDNERLINVKYLHDDREFYSYTPSDKIPDHVTAFFNVTNTILNNGGVVVFEGVHTDATGVVKCVVSTEAAGTVTSSSVLSDSTFVTVVEEPRESPNITLKSKKFQIRKEVKANCSSRGGAPLANLTWYVNGDEVDNSDTSRIKQYTEKSDVNSSVSELTLPVLPGAYNGTIHLRCEATQFALYNASTEVLLEEEASSSSSMLQFPFTGRVGGGVVISVAVSVIHHSLQRYLS